MLSRLVKAILSNSCWCWKTSTFVELIKLAIAKVLVFQHQHLLLSIAVADLNSINNIPAMLLVLQQQFFLPTIVFSHNIIPTSCTIFRFKFLMEILERQCRR